MKNIIIGGAWPYANGSLHIGHIAGLLPGDVIARYYRAKGYRVFYVSGSDCHGTPITIRAKQENKAPETVSEQYHREFCDVFERLGFSYDLYTKTSDIYHKEFVQKFHKKLYTSAYIEERTVKQAYCPTCQKVLTDRLVVGTCPKCGAAARGDQCDACGDVLDIDTVVSPKCADCGADVEFGETTQLFLLISRLKNALAEQLLIHPHWRKNAITFTKRYIDEGLRDRAITRDLEWGITVPKDGYENKRIYIWAENVLGYLSAVSRLCEESGVDFHDVFGQNANTKSYYVHGKDNIPFHTIILPALLLAHGEGIRLPDEIISSEYVTLEGRKISTSQNFAVWANDLLEKYDPDTIRYFFIANGPEKRDADFSWHEFKEQNNSELVGAWGNFVNRTLAFILKFLNNKIPVINVDTALTEKIENTFYSVGKKIENGAFKDALDEIFETIRFGNKYYDAQKPWKTRTENITECQNTIGRCVYLIANIAVLLRPFLPFSSAKVIKWLELSPAWEEQKVPVSSIPDDIGVLFSRIE